MSILILYEHPDRELQVATVMADIFREVYNKPVVVASIVFHGFLCLYQKFEVVIVPSYKWRFIEFLAGYKPNLLVITLNYEQMLSQFNKQIFPPSGSLTLSKVIHFSWSEEFSQYLISNGVFQNNIHVVSKYIYQIYGDRKLKNPVLLKYEEFIKNYDQIIFVPLTDLQAFKSNRRLKREFSINSEYLKAVSRRDYVLQTVTEIFHSLNILAEKNSNKLIVFRPHPSIGVENYSELFQKFNFKEKNNFIINYEFSAIDWVLVSDIVVSNYSSVLLDALFYNKKAIIYEPKPLPAYLYLDWMDKFAKVCDLSQLNQFLFESSSLKNQDRSIIPKSVGISEAVNKIVTHKCNNIIKSNNFNRFIYFIKLIPYVLKCLVRLFLYTLNSSFVSEGLRRDYRKII